LVQPDIVVRKTAEVEGVLQLPLCMEADVVVEGEGLIGVLGSDEEVPLGLGSGWDRDPSIGLEVRYSGALGDGGCRA
jgi:hypothetical protein